MIVIDSSFNTNVKWVLRADEMKLESSRESSIIYYWILSSVGH